MRRSNKAGPFRRQADDTSINSVTPPAYMYEHVGVSDVQVSIVTLVNHVVVWSHRG